MVVVLVVAAGAAWESPVLELVAGRPGLVVLKRCVDVDDLLAAGSAGQADAALVALDAPGLDPAAVDLLHRHQIRVVAVAGSGSPDAARARAARVGVDALADERDLPRVLDLLEDDDEPIVGVDDLPDVDVPAPSGSGRVVVVWGPAGAPGRTLVATSLARPSPAADCAPRSSTPTPTPRRSPSTSESSTRSPGCSAPRG